MNQGSATIRGFLNFPRKPAGTGHLSAASCSMSENMGQGQTSGVAIGEKDGLIIVDHGSRRIESNLMLSE